MRIAPHPSAPDGSANEAHAAYARHHDAVAAVECCVALLGAVQPVLLLVFCGGKHDPVIAFAALRAAYGGVPIVGGSAAGAIACGKLGYGGAELRLHL